jgi:RNA polymerase primary sigma factor
MLFRKIRKSYQSLSQILMRQPKLEEVAADLGIPVRDVEYIVNMTNGMLSLEMDINSDNSSALEDVHEDYTYNPERTFLRKNTRTDTIRFLNLLKDREKRILMYRYQLNGCEQHTLKTIGDKMGISPETVRQIEMKALAKMRSHADELRTMMGGEAAM